MQFLLLLPLCLLAAIGRALPTDTTVNPDYRLSMVLFVPGGMTANPNHEIIKELDRRQRPPPMCVRIWQQFLPKKIASNLFDRHAPVAR
jgi:hypothetical protein